MQKSVIIVGGGVIGLCAAYYLVKEGNKVIVIDRNDITDGCSFGNMGYVSPSHFTPIATPGIVAQGLRWMLSSSSPFYIKPRLNLDLIRWGLTFRKSANTTLLKKNILHLNNLLQLSRELITDLKETLPGSFGLHEKGCWMLYKTEKTADHEKHLAEQAADLGLKTIMCNPAEVQKYETEAEVNIKGGVLYLDDCHLEPAKLMQQLHAYLEAKGVELHLQTTVTGFEKQGKKISAVITNKGKLVADEIVLANGSWMPQVSALLNIPLLLQPGKGYSYLYHDLEKNLQYPSILVDDRVATSPYGRSLRIGGTMELSGHSDNILPKRVMALYHAFKKYYPSMAVPEPDSKKAWFGYRPVTPDGMPYIGRHSKYDNLIYAGGHAMLGVSAATGTGKLVTELVNGAKASISLEAFNPSRFS